jgi:hypothetical protein
MSNQHASEQHCRHPSVPREVLHLAAVVLMTSLSGCLGVADGSVAIPRLLVEGMIVDAHGQPVQGVAIVLARPEPNTIRTNDLDPGNWINRRSIRT